MKTLFAFSKMVSSVLLYIVFSSTAIEVNAQETDEKKKEVKIKMIKQVDGEETIIDTTFEVTSLEELDGLEDIDVIIGDELIENLGIKLSKLNDNEDVDVQVMSFETDGDSEKHTMIITTEMDEESGENGESIKTIDLIVEVADSLDNAKIIKLTMDGDEHAIFISEDEEMRTIKTEDGKKTIIIKHVGDGEDEDIMLYHGDEANWHEKMGTNIKVEETEDGSKVIVTEENGEVKEYIIKDGKGAYMINEEGNVIKMESDKDIIWNEDGDNIWVDVETEDDGKVVIIKSSDGKINVDDMNMEHNVFIEKDGDGEEKEVFVNVTKKKEGDKTIVIKTKVIIETPDDEDIEKMEKAGVKLFPESEENKLEIEGLIFSPNPSNGKFTLKFTTPEEGNTDIKIYNINGTEVYSESLKNFNGTYEKEIDISGEKSGTYFLKVAQGNNIMSRKIVIE